MPTVNAKLVIRTLALQPRAVEALTRPQLALGLAIVSVRKIPLHLSPSSPCNTENLLWDSLLLISDADAPIA